MEKPNICYYYWVLPYTYTHILNSLVTPVVFYTGSIHRFIIVSLFIYIVLTFITFKCCTISRILVDIFCGWFMHIVIAILYCINLMCLQVHILVVVWHAIYLVTPVVFYTGERMTGFNIIPTFR